MGHYLFINIKMERLFGGHTSDIPIFNLTLINGKYFECEVFWHAAQMVLNDNITMTYSYNGEILS